MTLGPQIVNGIGSPDDQNSVVMILAGRNADNPGTDLCTGTVIAPRLVLTARHCVSALPPNDPGASCNLDGSPAPGSGGIVGADYDPSNIYVFAGIARADHTSIADNDLDAAAWTNAVRASAIIHDGAPNLCAHDLALLVLDAPIIAPVAALRLDRDVSAGETTVAVGWGKLADGSQPFIRQQRRDVSIRRVGPADGYPTLPPMEFQIQESICEGDSGGPILDQATGAVVGVVSRGGNGEDPDEVSHGANTCLQANNIITKLSPFRAVFDRGFAAAGSSPKLEAVDDPSDCNCRSTRAPAGDALVLALVLFAISRSRRLRPARR